MATPHAVAIKLSEADRAVLLGWSRCRKTAQALALRARIMLACTDSAATNTAIVEAMGVSLMTVSKWRRRSLSTALPNARIHPARELLARSWTSRWRP